MEASSETVNVQIISSIDSSQRFNRLRANRWSRPLALFLLPLALLLWLALLFLTGFLVFANLMSCGWIRPLHRLSRRLLRRLRWLGIALLSLGVAVFSPALSLAMITSYCLIHSYDFPALWIDWFMGASLMRGPKERPL